MDDKALAVYSKICELILIENNFINQRVTWGISVNGAIFTLAALGYSVTKDSIADKHVLAVAAALFAALALLAVYISYQTIKGIGLARKQVYYIRSVYNKHWKSACQDGLNLPRPFGSRLLTQDAEGNEITLRPSSSDRIFKTIIMLWLLLVLAIILKLVVVLQT